MNALICQSFILVLILNPNEPAYTDTSSWLSGPWEIIVLRVSTLIYFPINKYLRVPQSWSRVTGNAFLIQRLIPPQVSYHCLCIFVWPLRQRSQPLGTGEGALTPGMVLATAVPRGWDTLFYPSTAGGFASGCWWGGRWAPLLEAHGIQP